MSTETAISRKRGAPSRASGKSVALKKSKIVRDATFTRAVADDVAVLHLGRDIELAFLQYGGCLNAVEEGEDHFRYVGDDTIAEVARVRIDFPQVLKLALRIVQYGIESNRLKGDALVSSIRQWTSDADTARSGGADGDRG